MSAWLNLERYVRLPSEVARLPNLTEAAKSAIVPTFRGQGGCVMMHLVLSAVRSCLAQRRTFVSAPASEKLRHILKKAGIIVTDVTFKYDECDQAICNLLFADQQRRRFLSKQSCHSGNLVALSASK